jgi:hypothetical protein
VAKAFALPDFALAEYLDLGLAAGPAASGAPAPQTSFSDLFQGSVAVDPAVETAATSSTLAALAGSFSLGSGVGPLAEIPVAAIAARLADTAAASATTTAPPGIVIVALGSTSAQIQALIDTVPDGTTLQFQAGHYALDSTLTVARDNITLIGAGSDKTIFDVRPGLGQEAFNIGEGQISGAYTLAANLAEGGKVMTLTGAHSFQAGDYVYLSRENTDAFFDEIGDELWREADSALRTSIVQIESVVGTRITFTSGVHFDFTTGETTISEISMAEGVAVGGFSVDYGLGSADPGNFSNTMSAYDRNAVIEVEGTAGLNLFDVASHDVPSLGVNFALSVGIEADGIVMTGAHNKGDNGNGYGIQIRDVYDSNFINISDQDMRHSVVFASWRSSAGNFVQVAFTDRDINFHGGLHHDNVVMVDNSLRDANSDIITPTLFVNSDGTSYGAPTDMTTNSAAFGNVMGTRLNDTVQGYDNGAALDGAGGHDCLTGGLGNDLLTGNTGNDSLFGGGGVDIAVYAGNFASYAITYLGSGQFELRDKTGVLGIDKLTGMEWLQFADGAYNLSSKTLSPLSAIDGIFAGPGSWDGPEPAPVLIGTEGRDTFIVTIEGTSVHGLGEFDKVQSSVTITLGADVERLDLTGTAAINGTGSAIADQLHGNDSANVIKGMEGNDRIWGAGGNDTLMGGEGAERLYGDAGNDRLDGGAGQDKLYGGDGADVFVFTLVADTPRSKGDRLMDFQSGIDKIDLSAIDANTNLSGNQAFTWTTGANGAGSLWGVSGYLYADTNGDKVADLAIYLTGLTAAGDIIF